MGGGQSEMDGGTQVAQVLAAQGVEQIYTLCGGHISPILVESKKLGIRIIDTRHEVNAVFAADATGRVTGVPGVAAVTAGPGVSNTITAVKTPSWLSRLSSRSAALRRPCFEGGAPFKTSTSWP